MTQHLETNAPHRAAMFHSSKSIRRLPWLILILVPLALNLPVLIGYLHTSPVDLMLAAGTTYDHRGVGNPWIDPNTGFQAQALGKLAADRWLSGHIPWWNPFSGVGMPLAAEMQPGVFFLPFVLLYHFSKGITWVEVLMQILAGASTYAFCRKLQLSNLAACMAGLLFELNGVFGWHGAPIVTPVAFLPVLLFTVEALLSHIEAGRKGGWAMLSIALILAINAGFPETAFINGLLVAGWTVLRGISLAPKQRHAFVLRLSIGVVVALACSAPALVPFAEFISLANVGVHAGAFAHASLPASSAIHSLLPVLFGPIFSANDPASAITASWSNIGGYLGVVQISLALSCVTIIPRRISILFLGWTLFCLGKTFNLPPFADIFNLIPLIKETAFYRFSTSSWIFANVMLMALGLDALRRGLRPPRWWSLMVFVGSLAACAVLLWINREPVTFALNDHLIRRFARIALGWGGLSITALALLLALPRLTVRQTMLGLCTLLVLDAGLNFSLQFFGAARGVHRHGTGVALIQKIAQLQRTFSLGPLALNYGAYYGYAAVDYTYLPVAKNWISYLDGHVTPITEPAIFTGTFPQNGVLIADHFFSHQAAFEDMGVSYVLVDAGKFSVTQTSGDTSTNNGQMQAATGRSLGTTKDLHGNHLVYSGPDMQILELAHPKPYFEIDTPGCAASSEKRDTVTVICQQPTTLLRREAYYPGWSVSIDQGASSPVHEQGMFQSATVPAGKHVLHFTYQPSHFAAMMTACGLGFLCLLIELMGEMPRIRRSFGANAA